MDGERTWFFYNSDSFAAQPSYHLPWPLCIMHAIPSRTSQSPFHFSILREHDSVFASLWIGGIPCEGHAFVDLDDGAVERSRAADVEVEDAGTGLVAYEEEVLEMEWG